MGSIDQTRFEDMMAATVPNVDLTLNEGVYRDEGVQGAWIGYVALHRTTTCSVEDNQKVDTADSS